MPTVNTKILINDLKYLTLLPINIINKKFSKCVENENKIKENYENLILENEQLKEELKKEKEYNKKLEKENFILKLESDYDENFKLLKEELKKEKEYNKKIDNELKISINFIEELLIQKSNLKEELKIEKEHNLNKYSLILEKKDLENNNNLLKLEKEELKKNNSNFLQTINEYIIILMKKNNEIKKLKDELKNKNNCSICLENEISTACFPCGHTYCISCIDNTNKCHICRTYIKNIERIYL